MPFQPPQVGEQLLTASARHLRAWMEPTAEEQAYLRKYNDIDMVLLLTGEGPKYILKSQTRNCRRVNRNLYYNHSFVNVLFALMLQKHGKSEAVFFGANAKIRISRQSLRPSWNQKPSDQKADYGRHLVATTNSRIAHKAHRPQYQQRRMVRTFARRHLQVAL